ncbi:MAG: ketoacyl-ACP synthase III [Candidatus Omnitrophica bacterium]|nr:ketoacyl-ACP synthase III [Candidatus Omnitrophota bacterium]HOX54052.1 beta-ketoacyl-ACP synthase III [Candidatus Omnitrophota bacterium]
MKNVGIIGLGMYVPEKKLTNQDLEKMVDTSDEWITTRTGIKERRIADKSQAASDLAVNAAREALAQAKLKPEDLDLIIVATITPDTQFPSTACWVQKALGAKKAASFDISAACAGYIYGITIAQQFIANGVYKNALVVGTEVLSRITDWTDRSTCVLFGDGAGSCVLAPVKENGILSTYLASDGELGDLLLLPAGGSRNPATHQTVDEKLHTIKMQGNEVFKHAVKLLGEATKIALEKVGLSWKDIDCVIPHQANIRILLAMAKRIGVPEDKIYMNIARYGNMSSASTATALTEAFRDGKIKKGDIVVLVAFGGGLVWGSIVIKW